MITQIEEATRRKHCDWGFDERTLVGTDVYEFLLPEMNEMREIARILALRTKVAMAESDYPVAIDNLRMGYQASVDTGSGLTLVSKLIGIAMTAIANEQLIDLISCPDAPNLYWAVSELPSPMIELKPAIRFEMDGAYRMFPYLKDAETARRTPEEWNSLITQIDGPDSAGCWRGPAT